MSGWLVRTYVPCLRGAGTRVSTGVVNVTAFR